MQNNVKGNNTKQKGLIHFSRHDLKGAEVRVKVEG